MFDDPVWSWCHSLVAAHGMCVDVINMLLQIMLALMCSNDAVPASACTSDHCC